MSMKVYINLLGLCLLVMVSSLILNAFHFVDFTNPIFTREYDTVQTLLPSTLLYFISMYGAVYVLRLKGSKLIALMLLIYCATMNVLSIFQGGSVLLIFKYIADAALLLTLGTFKSGQPTKKDFLKAVIVLGVIILYNFTFLTTKRLNNLAIESNPVANLIAFIDYGILLFIVYKINKGGDINVRFNLRIPKRGSKNGDLQKDSSILQESVNTKAYVAYLLVLIILQSFLMLLTNYIISHYMKSQALTTVTTILIIIFVSFSVMRNILGESWHSKNLIVCTILTCLVFAGAVSLTLPISISILVNPLLGLGIAIIFHHMHKYEALTEVKKQGLYKGMPLSALDKLNAMANLEAEYEILEAFYVRGMSRVKASSVLYTSESTISRRLRSAKQKIESLD